jgi:hypothetical protein
MRISPPPGFKTPPMARSVVDLPAPCAPSGNGAELFLQVANFNHDDGIVPGPRNSLQSQLR